MKTQLTLLLMIASMQMNAQQIMGIVLDDKREPMLSVVVQIYENGTLKGTTTTDYDGNYMFKPLEPALYLYDVLTFSNGYDSVRTNCVTVTDGAATKVNFSLSRCEQKQCKLNVRDYKKPLINSAPASRVEELLFIPVTSRFQHGCGGHPVSSPERRTTMISSNCVIGAPSPSSYMLAHKSTILDREQINRLPYTQINDIIAASTGFYQRQRGAEIHVFGGR